MSATDQFQKGMYLEVDDALHQVVDRKYKTQGRQGGLIILNLKNLETGHSTTKTIKAGTKLEAVAPEYREGQYLYSDDSGHYFMDVTTYETVTLAPELVGEYSSYLKEGDKNVILYYEDRPVSIRKNPTVELKVTQSVDAVKGNTANSATKLVTTETGYRVQVPLFVNKGDMIIINTESGEYSGRA